jgi:cytochrome P450
VQTVTALQFFFLAMVLFPEAQRKAQKELDDVVGLHRLLEFEDRADLPYVDALCKEILRWQPVTPLGFAHRVTQDDIFGQYFIPSGSLIVGNTWLFYRP